MARFTIRICRECGKNYQGIVNSDGTGPISLCDKCYKKYKKKYKKEIDLWNKKNENRDFRSINL